MTRETVRRAGARWRVGAPPYVVDCFDMGERYADRYTVFVLPVECGELCYLTTSASGRVSGWASMPLGAAAAFRYRAGRHRVTWASLPDSVRKMVQAEMGVA